MREKIYETLYYDIYGYRIRLESGEKLKNLFELFFNMYRSNSNERKLVHLIISPVVEDTEPLPIQIKGGRGGINIKIAMENSREIINLEYEKHIKGTELELVLNYSRFLFFWENKCVAHAGAVAKGGSGYIFFAPQNTGKTTLVMYLMNKGYSYIADDWVIVDTDKLLYLYPQPINLYDYNFANNYLWCKEYFHKRANIIHYVMRLRTFFKINIVPYIPNRVLRYGINWLLSFPIKRIDIQSLKNKIRAPVPIKKAFWLERDLYTKSIQIEPIKNKDIIVDKVVSAFMFEWAEYFKWYYLTAQFGNKVNYIEDFKEHMRKIIGKALYNVECNLIYIPQSAKAEQIGESIIYLLNE